LTLRSPYSVKDITKIESVQRSFTKRLPGLSNLLYTKRLEVLVIIIIIQTFVTRTVSANILNLHWGAV